MTNKEKMQEKIKTLINGNKSHGWGIGDSLVVIVEIIANETGGEAKDFDNDEFVELIKSLINPSQFRQRLEKAGVLSETKEKKQKNAIDELLGSL